MQDKNKTGTFKYISIQQIQLLSIALKFPRITQKGISEMKINYAIMYLFRQLYI